MFVGRGPVSAVHVATTGAVPTTRVTVDLLRPATYRVIPPEEGEKDFTVLFEEDAQPLDGGAAECRLDSSRRSIRSTRC